MNKIGITILLATYNRSEILRNTLNSFTRLNFGNLNVEIVIVDNNSSDDTYETVKFFEERLPIIYLFESKTGKNSALNRALTDIDLKDLVVFTDDDVQPDSDWLLKIAEVSERWPDVSVFGGRIYPIWACPPPKWIEQLPEHFLSFAYAVHNCGDIEVYYGPDTFTDYPFGPNYWVRLNVFENGRRFDESIGPVPDNKMRIMGSETSMLMSLAKDGYKIVYSPEARVGHCITGHQMSKKYLFKRLITRGNSHAVYADEFKNESVYRKSLNLWRLYRCCSLMKHMIKKYLAILTRNEEKSFLKRGEAEIWIAYNLYYLKNHKELYYKKLNRSQSA